MELRGDSVVLRPLDGSRRRADRRARRSTRSVARWWPGLTPEDVAREGARRGEGRRQLRDRRRRGSRRSDPALRGDRVRLPSRRHRPVPGRALPRPRARHGCRADDGAVPHRRPSVTTASRSTLPPTTSVRSGATRRSASSVSESCASTGWTPTASGGRAAAGHARDGAHFDVSAIDRLLESDEPGVVVQVKRRPARRAGSAGARAGAGRTEGTCAPRGATGGRRLRRQRLRQVGRRALAARLASSSSACPRATSAASPPPIRCSPG